MSAGLLIIGAFNLITDYDQRILRTCHCVQLKHSVIRWNICIVYFSEVSLSRNLQQACNIIAVFASARVISGD